MRVVALLAVRNEELYLERCLEHLFRQGIETCLIDNESTDATRSIAQRFTKRGVFRIETQRYPGYFDLVAQLRMKEELACNIDADWFIHHDADETFEAPSTYGTVLDGLIAVDRQGYTAINFDEFVFLPTLDEESYEGTDYVKAMRFYYFFQPKQLRLVRAWKKIGSSVILAASGGHSAEFPDRKIYPVNFVLRHYIVLSRAHAIAKYKYERIYSSREVDERGWHGARARFDPSRLRLPARNVLKCLDDGPWDTSQPWKQHTFLGEGTS